MPPQVSLIHGSYRPLTAALAEQLAVRRAPPVRLAEWLAEPIEIVVPSAGASEAIQQELLRRIPQGTCGIRFQTLEALAGRIVSQSGGLRRVVPPEERSLAMQAAARTIRTSDPLFDSPNLATMLDRSFRDVVDSALGLEEVSDAVRRHISPSRFKVVVGAWSRYRELIERSGSVDQAEILHVAIGALRKGFPLAPVILFGFYDATILQQRMIEAMLTGGGIEAIWLPVPLVDDRPVAGYGFAEPFVRRLQPHVVTTSLDASLPTPSISFERFAHRNLEISTICRRIADSIAAGVAPGRIGLVQRRIPDAEISAFQREAETLGFRFSTPETAPLPTHRLGRGVSALLTLRRNDFRRREVIEILDCGMRSERAGRWSDASRLDDVARRLGITGGRTAVVERQLRASGELRDYDRSLGEEYVRLTGELERLVEPLSERQTGRRWSEELLRLLDLFAIRTEADLAAAEAIEQIAARLARTTPASELSLDLVVDLLFETRLEVEAGDRAGVWLGDVMKARGRSFDILFIDSVQDDSFPQRRTDDPLIPDEVRPRFGVRLIGDGEEEERLLFDLLLQSADRIHLSYSSAAGNGGATRPSRFLLDLALRIDPSSIREIVTGFEAWVAAQSVPPPESRSRGQIEVDALLASRVPGERLSRTLRLVAGSGSRSAYDGYLTVDDSVRAAIDRRLAAISPTRLELYGQCPQRFLLAIAGVTDLADPDAELELEARKRGEILHLILERFYRGIPPEGFQTAVEGDPPRLSPELERQLRKLLDEAFAELDQNHPPLNPVIRRMEKREAGQRLVRFVSADLRELAGRNLTPVDFELVFGSREGSRYPPVPLELQGLTVSIRGSIDRVDAGADGSIRIVDYKDGKAVRYDDLLAKIGKGQVLQLPFYAFAMNALGKASSEKISATIKPLALPRASDRMTFRWSEVEKEFISTLELFIGAIREGRFPALPGKQCDYCPASQNCRTRFDPEELLALRSVSDTKSLLMEIDDVE
jgi:ATP-dependent helicase/nuclease subunit B